MSSVHDNKKTFGFRAAAWLGVFLFGTAALAVCLWGGSPAPPAASSNSPGSLPGGPAETASRPATPVLLPEHPGTVLFESEDGDVAVDASNARLGYVMVRCRSDSGRRIKVQVLKGEAVYSYDLTPDGSYVALPLQMDSGAYGVVVYENVRDSRYAPLFSATFDAEIDSAYAPFLLPNQYVDYTGESRAVKLGLQLTERAKTELGVVREVFDYVVANIRYDTDKAEAAKTGDIVDFLPRVDEVVAEGKGICFDYAAVFAAMLRSQGIPAKLAIGYVQPKNVLHAWNEVFISDVGWVSMTIEFDGVSWALCDTTYAAARGTSSDAVGGGTGYRAVYVY